MDIDNPIPEEDDETFLASLNALLAEDPQPTEEPQPEQMQPPQEPKSKEKPKKQQAKHAKKRCQKPSKKLLTGLAIGLGAALVLALAVPAVLRALDPYGGKIAPGVSVGTVELGGLSKGAAKKALADAYGTGGADTPLVVSFPELQSILDGTGENAATSLTLSPKDTGVHLDAAKAAKAAYALVRDGSDASTQLSLVDYLHLDESYLRSAAEDYAAQLQALYQEGFYQVEGSAPDISAEGFREDAPCQSVLLTRGFPGIEIDTDHLYAQILDAYENQTFAIDYDGTVQIQAPKDLDLDAIWQETRVEAREPSVDLSTYQVIPGQHGYEFDLDKAKAEFDNLPYGGTMTLELHYTAPETADEDAYFQDTLGYCETPHSNNENRNSNLKKACEMLNGLVLQPGQEFSYNETLGERTKEKGWLPAPAYSGTTLVDSPGGGICQVSSTLYLASVYAELTILERVNHGYPVRYIPLGMDATVNWGFTDLKMRNDSPMPVKIVAEETDDLVKVTILGTETRNYTIEMTYSVGGRHVKTFKSKYDKDTGELISKETVALSSYLEDIYK